MVAYVKIDVQNKDEGKGWGGDKGNRGTIGKQEGRITK